MSKMGIEDMLSIIDGTFGDNKKVKEKQVGRIVTGFNNAIVGIETIDTTLKANYVYEIVEVPSVGLMLKPLGESHINFDKSTIDIGTTMLKHGKLLIATKEEKNDMKGL